MSHLTVFVAQTLSQSPLVSRIEDLLQSLYSFFLYLPKHSLELEDVSNVMELARQRILKNIITRWISCFKPVKLVMQEYRALVLKMHMDASTLQQLRLI
jgi:hypothetical protein